MGQSPFPAELATLANHQHKEIEQRVQDHQAERPSTFQFLQQAHSQPLLFCEALLGGV